MTIERQRAKAANPDDQKKVPFNNRNKFNTISGEQNNESFKRG